MNHFFKKDIDISIVIIGYNEAETLGQCVESVKHANLEGLKHELIFVDGGSKDNSIEIANELGVDLLLGGDRRRKAAENRNLGLARSVGEFIQFIDGDMQLHPDWIVLAYNFLKEHPDVAAVCGNISEMGDSLFLKALQIDWTRQDGEIHSCGGAAMWRKDIISKMDGFPEDVSYGEEPYLCWRIRNELGLKIHYIDKPMVDHDLGFSGFSDYWRRDIRCGETYAEIASRCHGSPDPLYGKETISNLVWGSLFIVAMGLFIFGNSWIRLFILTFAFIILLRKGLQTYFKKQSPLVSFIYAFHTYFVKLPLALGSLLWFFKHFKKNRSEIDESSNPQQEIAGEAKLTGDHKFSQNNIVIGPKARIAYLNTRYPALSHTFIEREIRAIKEKGMEVHSFSIRHPVPEDLMSQHHRSAAEETFYILDGVVPFIFSILHGFLLKPLRSLRCLMFAQKISPPGLKTRALHLVYALESIRLGLELIRRNLYHIHVHMANNGATVAMLTCLYDKRINYSMTIHGSAEFFNVNYYYLKTKVERAQFVRCISHFCKAQIMIWTDPDKWKDLHIVHCGVDMERFEIKGEEKPEKFRILFVGRLESIKGLLVLLKAFKKLNDSGMDCELDIVGEGPIRKPLMHKVEEMGIRHKVLFSGAVSQDRILDHYDRANVFVISSFMEGIPVVLMEAMAKGLPVISTNVGGISELVADKENGLLIPPASVNSLLDALSYLADNRKKSAGLGRQGRKKIIEEFSMEKIGIEMAALFNKYLDGGSKSVFGRMLNKIEESPHHCEEIPIDY